MKRYIIISALLASAITSGFAQSNVDAFFHADPYLDFTQEAAYAHRNIGYVGYRLISPFDLQAIDQNFLNQGCVRLGFSSWKILPYYGGGMPDKEAVISYARSIGADLVLYILAQELGSEYYDHTVYFYASKSIARKAR